jgi:hypothetical protein
MPGFKPISEKRLAALVWQHGTEREKNGHGDLVLCRKRSADELRDQPRQYGQSWPLPGCDIKAELVLAKIEGLAGIHEFLVRLKPPYDRAQMFHPCQKAINVALKRAGVRHTPEARIVAAVDAITSELFRDADNIAQKWRGEHDNTVDKLVVGGFPKEFTQIPAEHVPRGRWRFVDAACEHMTSEIVATAEGLECRKRVTS